MENILKDKLQEWQKNNLKTIAIANHNTIDGLEETISERNKI